MAKRTSRTTPYTPICCFCSKVRPGQGDPTDPSSWIHLEPVKELLPQDYTHGICPSCLNELTLEAENSAA